MTRSDYQPVVSEGEEAAAGHRERQKQSVGGAAHQQGLTPVQQFFSGRSVLVTGATGFMGKVLVEKLLRSCPGLDTVYAIIRPKKGRTIEQRKEDMAKDSVFSRLGEDQWRRLVAVAGDIAQPGLGLSAEDRTTLCDKVSVVFHFAATVRFDEPLKVATTINVRGTQEVLRLSKDMSNLKAVVYASTAYSQCVRRRVEERFYEAPIAPAKLLALCDAQPEDSELTARLLGEYPNTYVFTKAVAEQLVNEESSDLPVAVVRPAMVSSTNAEPYPGWIDNVYGPTGVSVGCATGLLRVMNCDERAMANIVPCDMSVNCAIAAAWDVATNRHLHKGEQPVYNHVSSTDAPLTWHEYRSNFVRHGFEVPVMQSLWYPSLRLVQNRLLFLFWRTLLHLVPAILVDTALVLTGRKPKLMRGYRKIHLFIDVCAPFATHFWDFDNTQAKALWARLSSEDRQLLPFDMRDFKWDHYFHHYVRGTRSLLLKEELDTVPAAKVRYTRLKWLHRGLNTAVILVLLSLAWRAGTAIVSLVR